VPGLAYIPLAGHLANERLFILKSMGKAEIAGGRLAPASAKYYYSFMRGATCYNSLYL
jgi:hypothetical protein